MFQGEKRFKGNQLVGFPYTLRDPEIFQLSNQNANAYIRRILETNVNHTFTLILMLNIMYKAHTKMAVRVSILYREMDKFIWMINSTI